MKISATSMTNENAVALLAEGAAAIERGEFDFDLANVVEVDTASIALLLEWQRQANTRGGKLALISVPADITSLAGLYGVDGLLGLEGHETTA